MGIGVMVSVGRIWTGVCVSVGGPGVVGNAVEATRDGKTVAPKLNKAVGVACVPALVGIKGLGVIAVELRDPRGNKLNRTEQRQQNASRTREGSSSLPSCPRWL